jgi:hypothetical protein
VGQLVLGGSQNCRSPCSAKKLINLVKIYERLQTTLHTIGYIPKYAILMGRQFMNCMEKGKGGGKK